MAVYGTRLFEANPPSQSTFFREEEKSYIHRDGFVGVRVHKIWFVINSFVQIAFPTTLIGNMIAILCPGSVPPFLGFCSSSTASSCWETNELPAT